MPNITGLYVASPPTLLTDHIKDVQPVTKEVSRIESVLLSGTPVIQIVGTPMKIFTFIANAEEDIANAISGHWANGTLLTLYWLDEYATGYIRESPSWSEDGYRYYTATMSLISTTSGSQ
jgi:hypothetical protein